jgi:uncharacterized membrane protein
VKKAYLARIGALALVFALASCAGGQAGTNNQAQGTFNDPPAFFRTTANILSLIIEAAGILTIFLAVVIGGYYFFRNFRHQEFTITYRDLREHIGRGILIGLELLVAADIIGTVAISPTFENLAVLGLVVLIRTFLSFAIDAEIHGRWPWQAAIIGSKVKGGEVENG